MKYKHSLMSKAYDAVTVKQMAICRHCNESSEKKCKRKEFCLPSEIVFSLLCETEPLKRSEMINNLVSNL